MDPERWRRIEEVYHEALECDGEARRALLAGADVETRREVESLLSDASDGTLLDGTVADVFTGSAAFSLSPSARLGPYKIEAKIGTGGMGQVWKARDTRLGRDVAIKACTEGFSDRFRREARAIAALNHPHICTLYDIGANYLVMEYIEGVPIQGPLPTREAMRLAGQIAAAMWHAHQHGVIHRDLKPGNILVSKAGAKVLDFGLAKLSREKERGSHASPVTDVTEPGTILGTLRYMAPEQVKGGSADQRSDIFAFGVVLYEMLTGHPAFQGDTQAELVAGILKAEPEPVANFHPGIPPALDHLIRTCLAKNPEDRWQTMHDALLQLQWIGESRAQPPMLQPAAGGWKHRERFAWASAAVVAAALTILASVHLREKPRELHGVRFQVTLPQNLLLGFLDYAAVSPDGRQVVFSATDVAGKRVLWARRINSEQLTPVPGTNGAIWPFWSADSRYVGFRGAGDGRYFAFNGEGGLKRTDMIGGPAQTITNLLGNSWGGSWNSDGVILIGRLFRGAIYQASAAGGEPKPILKLDESRGEISQQAPNFLPDGRHFVYTSITAQRGNGGVYLASLDGGKPRRLLTDGSCASFVSPNFLLFVRGASLLGQWFDLDSLQLRGEPFTVVESLGGGGWYSASSNGTLVYQPVSDDVLQLTWADRRGKRTPVGEPRPYHQGSLSPNEKQMAIQIIDPSTGTSDIWALDISSGNLSRLTEEPRGASTDREEWSMDMRELLFSSNRNGSYALYRKSLGRGDEHPVLPSTEEYFPGEWLKDGSLLYMNRNGKSFFRLPAGVDKKPEMLLTNEYNKDKPRVSPDGRWVAYSSTDSGRWEVYLARFPEFTERRQVSNNGGSQGHWRKDGKELFYLALDGTINSVEVIPGPPLKMSSPQPLFQTRILVNPQIDQYAVTGDGQRFLLFEVPESGARTLNVVLNWPAR